MASIPAVLLLLLLSLLRHAVPIAADLSRLREFQRECFKLVQPCIMFMDEDTAYGCAQCGEDVVQELVREYVQRDQLLRFLESEDDSRIVMIPEYLFFLTQVLNALTESKTVAAVVVYEPTPDPSPLPFPPLQIPEMSTDRIEPNRKYNFYYPTPDPSEDEASFPHKRNSVGKGLKYALYPFNIFRVNARTADFIRERVLRFPGENEIDVNPNTGNRSSSTSPRFKLQSVGRMYACPASLDATPTATASDDTSDAAQNPPKIPMNSKKCLEDKTCLPIGGQSLWSALGWVNPSIPAGTRKILAITAPMDSNAFFPDRALGAAAEIASLAVLMAVAEAVGKWRRSDAGSDRNMIVQPVYFVWNAQSWGYAGSSRFLKDVKEFKCEVKHEGLESGCRTPFMQSLKFLDFRDADFTILNIGQLTNRTVNKGTEADKFAFYMLRNKTERTFERDFEGILNKSFGSGGSTAGNSDFRFLRIDEGSDDVVPIDASQSFQRYMPDSQVVSVTNYETNFSNTLYHSIFDNTTLIEENIEPLAAVANGIAKAVISFSFDENVPTIDISRKVISQVLECMANDWGKCELASEYTGEAFPVDLNGNLRPVSPGNYPGSYFPPTRLGEVNPSSATKISFIESFLAYHNRYTEDEDAECTTAKDCEDFTQQLNDTSEPTSQSELRRTFCARRRCVASDTYRHNAYGTALRATNAVQSEFEYVNQTSAQNADQASLPIEAGWTESVWDDDLGLCGFVEDTALFGSLILGGGVMVLLASAVLTFWFDRMMFKAPSEPEETQSLVTGEATV